STGLLSWWRVGRRRTHGGGRRTQKPPIILRFLPTDRRATRHDLGDRLHVHHHHLPDRRTVLGLEMAYSVPVLGRADPDRLPNSSRACRIAGLYGNAEASHGLLCTT